MADDKDGNPIPDGHAPLTPSEILQREDSVALSYAGMFLKIMEEDRKAAENSVNAGNGTPNSV